ncbi:MAG: 1-acyl-sn-glycerol-3-phosphate acyltransferase, partial [Patescibacteria group bacterium]
MKSFYWLVQTLMWPLMWLGVGIFYRVTIRGKERLHGLSSPLLIIANHRSVLDPFLIGMALPWGSHLFPVRPMSEDLQFTGK